MGPEAIAGTLRWQRSMLARLCGEIEENTEGWRVEYSFEGESAELHVFSPGWGINRVDLQPLPDGTWSFYSYGLALLLADSSYPYIAALALKERDLA